MIILHVDVREIPQWIVVVAVALACHRLSGSAQTAQEISATSWSPVSFFHLFLFFCFFFSFQPFSLGVCDSFVWTINRIESQLIVTSKNKSNQIKSNQIKSTCLSLGEVEAKLLFHLTRHSLSESNENNNNNNNNDDDDERWFVCLFVCLSWQNLSSKRPLLTRKPIKRFSETVPQTSRRTNKAGTNKQTNKQADK